MPQHVVLTGGSREEPVECSVEIDEAPFRVMINGKLHAFSSARAYVQWGGRTIARPFAPNLLTALPDGYVDDLEDESDAGDSDQSNDDDDDIWDGCFENQQTSWGSDTDDDS